MTPVRPHNDKWAKLLTKYFDTHLITAIDTMENDNAPGEVTVTIKLVKCIGTQTGGAE